MPHYVASLDQGTTSSRCIIFNDRLGMVASHNIPHKQYTPHAGWLEHDPMELYINCCRCLAEAIKAAKAKDSNFTRVEAVGITNQRETSVAWDRTTGLPLCHAPVWSDARTYDIQKRIADKFGNGDPNFASAITGLPCSTYFAGFKYAWMLENVDAVKKAKEAGTLLFGTIDSWLIFKLSGGKTHLTDFTNASRTFLMNLHTVEWCPELCAKLGVPMDTLPVINSNSEYFCSIDVRDGGLGDVLDYELPITGCIGDQQASLFGNMCFAQGLAKCTYGTGCFLLMNVGTEVKYSTRGLLATAAYKIQDENPHYAIEASIAGAGATMEWLTRNMEILPRIQDMDRVARTVNEDCDGVTFVPSFGGLLAPYWDPSARGTIVGMTYKTTKAHIIRAALNAIAMQVYDSVRAMTADSNVKITQIKVDGGLTNCQVLMEIQAALLGVTVQVPKMKETTALGAALCAGLATHVWSSIMEISDIAAANAEVRSISPVMDSKTRQRIVKNWEKGLSRAKWANL